MNSVVVIYEYHGEYDDFTKNPLFVCNTVEEATLFIEALENKEKDLWDDVIKFFGDEDYIPIDIGFNYDEVKFLKI